METLLSFVKNEFALGFRDEFILVSKLVICRFLLLNLNITIFLDNFILNQG